MLLNIQDLVVKIKTRPNPTNKRISHYIEPVSHVELQVQKGETVALVGESGSGKSMLSLAIMQLLSKNTKVTGGNIFFENIDLLTLPESKVRKIRGKRISMIFQEPMTSLNPLFTVGEQIAEVYRIHEGFSHAKAQKAALKMLERVHILEGKSKCYPHELSGGMRQRVMIAMALACKPDLLIADEPTTALDVTTQAQIFELIEEIKAELNLSVLLITHDLGLVSQSAKSVYVMYAGKIVEFGPKKRIFSNPKHPYTAGLLRCSPRLGVVQERLDTIEGLVPKLDSLPIGCSFQSRCPRKLAICEQQIPLLDADHAACWNPL